MSYKITFPSKEVDKLLHAKIQYGQLFLFKIKHGYAVFRPLTVLESETLLSLSKCLTEVQLEDWVIENTLVSSTMDISFFTQTCGYFITQNIAQKIMILSNIQKEEEYVELVEQHRKKATTLQAVVEALITKAYPTLSPTEIRNMTQYKQIDLATKAEKITGQNISLGGRTTRNNALKKFRPDAEVIGGQVDITSPEVADKPDFNERF